MVKWKKSRDVMKPAGQTPSRRYLPRFLEIWAKNGKKNWFQ